jgi:hypothetical protein
MKSVAASFETFVRSSCLAPFSTITQSGHWKQLTVRTSRIGDVMAWAILHPQEKCCQMTDLKISFRDASFHFPDHVNFSF